MTLMRDQYTRVKSGSRARLEGTRGKRLQVLPKHRIIIEYDPENFAPEYLYPPLEEEDTEEQRSKGRYLPAWLRSLCRKVSTLFRGEE